MKIALVHYHLQPGGVTRVIENTIKAWETFGTGPDNYVVLSGRAYSGSKLNNVRIVDGLDYAEIKEAPLPIVLKQKMEEAARSALGQLPDVWHVHNHSLGKNAGLTGAVAELAKSGASLLLQPHDFAEDGRPQNFSNLNHVRKLLYPTSGKIHYAALNQRDQVYLEATIEDGGGPVHLLANAIAQQDNEGHTPEQKEITELPHNLMLYPVRAVRRKNLGEIALLSATHPEFHFANSLGPTNPSFLPIYQDWIDYGQNHKLNLTYGLGERTKTSFSAMVNHAQSIINVSVAEGFGLGFLEPWTFGKCLCGRNIPEITSDFSKLGVNLNNLYDELWIDSSMVDQQALQNSISFALQSAYRAYQRKLPKEATFQAFKAINNEFGVRFGSLNEDLQQQTIAQVKSSTYETDYIRKQAKLEIVENQIIEKNQTAVMKEFSLSAYGSKLLRIYQEVLESPAQKVGFADGEKMLDQFLSPERINLLRT